ncbi:MAG: hypothetical protein MRY21_08260 [Simkaniaceae bacterium]|nr:hypothetical protein [Simkaniaceae bacterium]
MATTPVNVSSGQSTPLSSIVSSTPSAGFLRATDSSTFARTQLDMAQKLTQPNTLKGRVLNFVSTTVSESLDPTTINDNSFRNRFMKAATLNRALTGTTKGQETEISTDKYNLLGLGSSRGEARQIFNKANHYLSDVAGKYTARAITVATSTVARFLDAILGLLAGGRKDITVFQTGMTFVNSALNLMTRVAFFAASQVIQVAATAAAGVTVAGVGLGVVLPLAITGGVLYGAYRGVMAAVGKMECGIKMPKCIVNLGRLFTCKAPNLSHFCGKITEIAKAVGKPIAAGVATVVAAVAFLFDVSFVNLGRALISTNKTRQMTDLVSTVTRGFTDFRSLDASDYNKATMMNLVLENRSLEMEVNSSGAKFASLPTVKFLRGMFAKSTAKAAWLDFKCMKTLVDHQPNSETLAKARLNANRVAEMVIKFRMQSNPNLRAIDPASSVLMVQNPLAGPVSKGGERPFAQVDLNGELDIFGNMRLAATQADADMVRKMQTGVLSEEEVAKIAEQFGVPRQGEEDLFDDGASSVDGFANPLAEEPRQPTSAGVFGAGLTPGDRFGFSGLPETPQPGQAEGPMGDESPLTSRHPALRIRRHPAGGPTE